MSESIPDTAEKHLDWNEVTLERLGLCQEELCYTHPDGRYSTRYEHLEGGIFRTKISGKADMETVQGEFAIEDIVIDSLFRRGLMYYQLCVLKPDFSISPELRYALKERATEIEGKNGGMAFIGTPGLIRGVGHFISFFFPNMRFSFHHSEEQGLAQIRQWVRKDFAKKGITSPYPSSKSSGENKSSLWTHLKQLFPPPAKSKLPKSLSTEFMFNDELDGIALLSADRCFVCLNPAFENLLGYSSQELKGKPDTTIFHQEDLEELKQEFVEVVQYRKPRGDITLRLLCRNGDVASVRCVISTLKNVTAKNGGYLIHIQDLREVEELRREFVVEIENRQRLTEELRKAKENAEQANKAKSRFLANMSHEFRTPLNSISGFAQILLEDAQKLHLPETMVKNLQHVQTSSETLAELINHALDFSKIDAGKMEVQEDVFDPTQLLRIIYHIHQPTAGEKGVDFNYEVHPELPRAIRSDRMKLHQIASNLVSNAIKFTAKEKTVLLKIERQQEKLIIQVVDQGIGIPEERLAAIFEAFTQADDSTTRRYGGTGLGLAITKELTELLKGTLSVKSTVGEGSVFTVTLPLTEVQESEMQLIDADSSKVQFAQGSRVLVVEDIQKNREMLQQILERLGLEVFLANDGEEGVEQTIKKQPELILMDLHLPGIDGLEAIRRIRKLPKCGKIPIISFSADAFHEQQQRALEAGANDTLTKPLNRQKLYPLLRKYLKGKLSSESAVTELLPLPSALAAEIRKEFETIAETAPFKSVQIVQMAENILEHCRGYDTPYREVAEQVRQHVYSNQTRNIPGLIEEALSN